jgi:ribosomal protein L7/L12
VALGLRHQLAIGYYVGVVLLLALLVLRRYISARFQPTNWLVRTNAQGLYIKFRSYLNYRLPDTDETVVFVSHGEVRSARLVRQRVKVADSEGSPSSRTLRFVEFDLGVDATALAKALDAERARHAPSEKRWYGSSSTLYQHYPVRMVSPSLLQVEWTVVPGWKKFLKSLRPVTRIEEPVATSMDFASLESLSREQQVQRLFALDAQGDTISAVYMARRLYGYSLKDAGEFVDELRKKGRVGAAVRS